MKRSLASLIGWSLCSTLFCAPVLAAPEPAGGRVYVRFDTEIANELEPIRASFDSWGAEARGGRRQWLLSQFELGLRHKGWEFAYLQRGLLDVRINESAAEFYGRIERKETFTPGESTRLELEVNGFTAEGLRLGYRREIGAWTLNGGLTVLKADHLMSGAMVGRFEALAENDFNMSASVDYAYYKDPLFGRSNVDEPEGSGWAWDIGIEWRPSSEWTLTARADDLSARIRWDDAPYTQALAHTERKRYDEDGYAVFDPLLSGREGYQDRFVQNLSPRYGVTASYQSGPWSAELVGQYQFGYSLKGLGFGYQLGGGRLTTLVWPQDRMLELRFSKQDWNLGLRLDSLEWGEVQHLKLGFSFGF